MSQPTSPRPIDLLTDSDRITLITLYELDQLNPVTLFPKTPTFPDYAITAALRAQGRIRCQHLGKLLDPRPLLPEEVHQAIFHRMLEGGVPDCIKAGSGVFMRCEPESHEAIAAALNNLVDFDLARRSEQRYMRNDRSMRWVLPGGNLLTGTCKHARHTKERTRAKATGKVDAWIVSLSFDGNLVYWHAQLGESPPEVGYSIEPSGRLIARALIQTYSTKSEPTGNGPSAESDNQARAKVAPEAALEKSLPPSRLKARAVYEWAMETIEGASKIPLRDVFDRIIEKLDALIASAPPGAGEVDKLQDLRNSLPPNAEAFGKYLRDAGIKRYNTKGERISKTSHFRPRKEM